MKLRLPVVCALAAAALGAVALQTGCVATVDGHTKAAVPFRKDKLVSRYELPLTRVLDAARQALKDNGVLQEENVVNHSFVAKCNERFVWVLVEEINPTLTQVTTQVRTRYGGVDIDVAAEIDKQIALNLQTGLNAK
ncbi:MAG: DUF3568 family protein [Verrucomicrobia bacterium]|nr:DUF3568 family protein [Verrucomicrobiota bacterium]